MANPQMLCLIDTHAHLDSRDYDADRAAVIARAFALSIGVITIGVDLDSSGEALRLAERHRYVWAAAGIHPHEARSASDSVLSSLSGLAEKPGVVAIGEIGLDYYRDLSPRRQQRAAFVEQLVIAQELDLPVVIHNRESTRDLLGILEKRSPHRGVIHSFLGDGTLAQEFISMGFHLGIGGPITFNKNDAVRNAVADVPLGRIVVETDCPYLTPVPHRGKRNEPSYVRYVAEMIAVVKGVPLEEVERRTTENAKVLFGLQI